MNTTRVAIAISMAMWVIACGDSDTKKDAGPTAGTVAADGSAATGGAMSGGTGGTSDPTGTTGGAGGATGGSGGSGGSGGGGGTSSMSDEDAGTELDGGEMDANMSTNSSSCGGAGEACCLDDTCDSGGCCVANVCIEDGEACGMGGGTCSSGGCANCGGDGDMCCQGNCQEGFSCVGGGFTGFPGPGGTTPMCEACGAAGDPCCAGAACESGSICVGFGIGTCQDDCGGPDQDCCMGGGGGFPMGGGFGQCRSGLTCNMGTCEGDPCGAPGEACCEGMGGGGAFFACSGGAGCVDGTCAQCGAEGQVCCDNGCTFGLTCGDNDRCEQPSTPDGGTGGPGGPGGFFNACNEVGEDCCTFMFGGMGGGGGGMSFCGNNLTCNSGTCE